MSKKLNIEIKCPHCGKNIKQKYLRIHLRKTHEINERDIYLYIIEKNVIPSELLRINLVPNRILIKYINKIWKENEQKPSNFYPSQFNSFYHSIIKYRYFIDSDFDLFFNSVLPWKLKHPGQMNSKELCSITFPDNPELANRMYKETMLVKNPYYKHDGSLSPFSKDFNGYKGLFKKEIEKRISKATQFYRNDRQWNQVKFWTNHGYSEEEAKKIISEKQATFSLEKCIEKYGETEGRKKWKYRQIQWQNTLKSKPKEEIERINSLKGKGHKYVKRSFSKISQNLFWKIYDIIKSDYKEIYFATNQTNLNNDFNNHEFEVLSNDELHRYYLDFYVKDNNKVIEFDGDYWHGEKRGNQERDRIREENLKQLGFIDIFHVKERDYNSNPEKVVEECLKFIRG